MLAWKLLVPVAAVLIGGGITATTLVQKGGFACVVPWYRDTSCGIPTLSIPPKGQLKIIVDAVTKDGKKYTEVCPTVKIFDAKTDKDLKKDDCEYMCDNSMCTYDNPSKETDQLVYVRFSGRELENVDVRGSFWVVQ